MQWQKVNTGKPCPVCGGYDGCMVSDSPKAAICVRKAGENGKPVKLGWFHDLSNSKED